MATLLAAAAWPLVGVVSALAAPEGDYAGSETCAECHDEVSKALKMTPHGKEGFGKLSSHGCEACHGPAKAHTENPDDVSLRPTMANRTAAERADVCTGCHEGGKQTFWNGSTHQKRGLACDDCHSVHAFKSHAYQIKTEDPAENCFACHKDIRAQGRKTSHHPVREGKMGCGDCHNPHGTSTAKMLNAASGVELCFECHTEKRGPFLWEHAPVREDCMNCHTPHGSNHQKLQTAAIPYICQQCHANTRHPGTLYDATTLPGAARQSNREFNRGCLNCHPSIHGSNHPSGPYLGR